MQGFSAFTDGFLYGRNITRRPKSSVPINVPDRILRKNEVVLKRGQLGPNHKEGHPRLIVVGRPGRCGDVNNRIGATKCNFAGSL